MKNAVRNEAERTENRSPGAAEEAISVTATVARKEFGRILDLVAQGRRVIITRYGVAAAVMMPVGRFDVSTAADTAMLDTLTAEFDALLESMQTAQAHAARDGMFNASPEQLDRILATAPRGKDSLTQRRRDAEKPQRLSAALRPRRLHGGWPDACSPVRLESSIRAT
jgi:antitoxin (DNA-binding transcriptional repressor) of toxin-antitoxin stability system